MSVQIPQQLRDAKAELEKGGKPCVTVRQLLAWFDAKRRRAGVVSRIHNALDKVGLVTDPEFEGEWIDKELLLLDKKSLKTPTKGKTEDATDDEGKVHPPYDPSYRLGRLDAANKPPMFVKPDETLQVAVTKMLTHDFSQLPVMTTERDVKGMISWKGIGSRSTLGCTCETVRDCMEDHHELRDQDSIFDAIRIVAEHDCVLVRGRDRKIVGLITGADLSNQFRSLAEPFLLLDAIENRLRSLVDNKFTKEELQAAKNSNDTGRDIESVSDLTLGELIDLPAC